MDDLAIKMFVILAAKNALDEAERYAKAEGFEPLEPGRMNEIKNVICEEFKKENSLALKFKEFVATPTGVEGSALMQNYCRNVAIRAFNAVMAKQPA